MRRRSSVGLLLGLLVCLSPLVAQQPPAPPAQPPAAPSPRLKQLLERWEAESVRTEKMLVTIKQTSKVPAFPNAGRVKEGSAKFMKLPDGSYGASLELKNPEDPINDYDKFICTGTFLYQFRPQTKEINVAALAPRQQGQAMDDGPMPFLFGMKSATATKRYQLSISKEDAWYTYVEVIPNFDRDQKEFTRAQLVILNKDTPQIAKDLPIRIFWIEPTKTQITWEIKEIQRNPTKGIDRMDFAPPAVPAGWHKTIVEASQTATPTSGQPRIIRNQNKD